MKESAYFCFSLLQCHYCFLQGLGFVGENI